MYDLHVVVVATKVGSHAVLLRVVVGRRVERCVFSVCVLSGRVIGYMGG